jgi:hypothetical protein
VLRVNTARRVALVENTHAVRYLAAMQKPRKTVRHVFVRVASDSAIALLVSDTLP